MAEAEHVRKGQAVRSTIDQLLNEGLGASPSFVPNILVLAAFVSNENIRHVLQSYLCSFPASLEDVVIRTYAVFVLLKPRLIEDVKTEIQREHSTSNKVKEFLA